MACRITVTCKEVKGVCHAGQQVGDVATFDGINMAGRICIHALASMMAKVFAIHQGVNFPWLDDPDIVSHTCPDATNPVTYELHRETADETVKKGS